MEFDIKIEGLGKVRRLLDPKLVNKAEVRTINDVAKMGRTAASKEIRKDYNISAKRMNMELDKVSGSNRATPRHPRAIIHTKKLSKRNPGIQHYAARETKKRGVTYKIMKQGGRVRLPHAFKATMSGGKGIFVRKGQDRLPIVRKTGPSVLQMMKKVGTEPVRRTVKDNFSRKFNQNYAFSQSRVR